MSRLKGLGGQRGAWRQQQNAAARLQRALQAPQLTNRVQLLRKQLEPLFLMLRSMHSRNPPGTCPSSSEGPADSGGSASDAAVEAYAEGRAENAMLEAAVSHLQACVCMDQEAGMNRVLLHGMLFNALEAGQDSTAASGGVDEFSTESQWRLPAELYGALVMRLGWGDLTQNAVAWLPTCSQQAAVIRSLGTAATAPWPALLALTLPGGVAQPDCTQALAAVVLQGLQQHQAAIPANQRPACITALARFLARATRGLSASHGSAEEQPLPGLLRTAGALLQDLLAGLDVSGKAPCPAFTLAHAAQHAAELAEMHRALSVLTPGLERELQADMAVMSSGRIMAPAQQQRFQAHCHLKARISLVQMSQAQPAEPNGHCQQPVARPAAGAATHEAVRPAVRGNGNAQQAVSVSSSLPGGEDVYSFKHLGRALYADTWARACSLAPDWGSQCVSTADDGNTLAMLSRRSSLAEMLAGQAAVQALAWHHLGQVSHSQLPTSPELQAMPLASSSTDGGTSASIGGADGDQQAELGHMQQLLGCSMHSPLQMGLVLLDMLRQRASRNVPSASSGCTLSAELQTPKVLSSRSSSVDSGAAVQGSMLPVLCQLCANALGQVAEPAQQHALLERVLQDAGMEDLRQLLQRAKPLQAAAAHSLIIVSNHMIAVAEAESFVFGAEPARVAAIAQELLPFAALAPEATLRRLVMDAVRYSGQGALVVEVLHEMPALACYRPPGAAHPHIVSLVADVLLSSAHSMRSTTAELAFLRFVKDLTAPTVRQQPSTSPATADAYSTRVLQPQEVLQALVIPQLSAAAAALSAGPWLASQAAPTTAAAAAGGASTVPRPAVLSPATAQAVPHQATATSKQAHGSLDVILKLALQTLHSQASQHTGAAEAAVGSLLSRASPQEFLCALCCLVDSPATPATQQGLALHTRALALQLIEGWVAALASYSTVSLGAYVSSSPADDADVAGPEPGKPACAQAAVQQLLGITAACEALQWHTRLLLLPLVALATAHAQPSTRAKPQPQHGKQSLPALNKDHDEGKLLSVWQLALVPSLLQPPSWGLLDAARVQRLDQDSARILHSLESGAGSMRQPASSLHLDAAQLEAALVDSLRFCASHDAHAQAFARICQLICGLQQQPKQPQHAQQHQQQGSLSSGLDRAALSTASADIGKTAAPMAAPFRNGWSQMLALERHEQGDEPGAECVAQLAARLGLAATSAGQVALREALLPACARVLPDCTTQQYIRIVHMALPPLLDAVLLAFQQPEPAAGHVMLHCAAVEVATRATYLVAFAEGFAAPAVAECEGPSDERCAAVDALLRHFSALCTHALAAMESRVERRMLAQRCLFEAVELVYRLQEVYDCSACQTLMLHLLKVLIEDESSEQPTITTAWVKLQLAKVDSPMQDVLTFAWEKLVGDE